jgi:hypothetical protein
LDLGLTLPNYADALIGAHHKLDSIQIHSAMTDPPKYSNRLVASGWKKFNLNLRSQGQIRHGKQAHPDITEIDAKSLEVGRASEYLDGGIQQLPRSATPVVEVAFDHVRKTTGVQGSAMAVAGEDYGGPIGTIGT